MKIEQFLTEKWMDDYERQARYNLTDTSADAHSAADLLALDPDCLSEVALDYGWITGDPRLRKEILNLYENRDEETLTLCCGALQANEMVMSMLLNPEDEVVTFTPGYQQYTSFPQWLGAAVRTVPFDENNGWSVNFEALEAAITDRTKLLVFANPSNPTGTWLKREELDRLIALCRPRGIWILCDEVYRDPADGSSSLCDLYEKGIATGSLSKMYGLAGLRTGWVKGPAGLIESINTFRDYTVISTGPLTERLAACALEHKDTLLAPSRRVLDANRNTIRAWLKRSPYFSCVLPEKAPVAFLKLPQGIASEDFARTLLEKTGIFFVPGSCFFHEGYLRLGLAKTHENLAKTLDELDAFTQRYLDEPDRLASSGSK